MTHGESTWPEELRELWPQLDSAKDKGKLLEQFCACFFGSVPGVEVFTRNRVDRAKSQELDIVLWNYQHPEGLTMLDQIVFVEAKNWSDPVGAAEVAWFDWKIRLSGRKQGFLIAANGITGREADRTSAWQIVAQANTDGRSLIIITPAELYGCSSPQDFQYLVRQKLVNLSSRSM